MIIGTAEISVLADPSTFDPRAAASKDLDGLAADADVAGANAGENLKRGLTTGAEDAAAGAEGAIGAGLGRAEEDAERSGTNIGSKLSSGISSGLGKLGNIASAVGIPVGNLGNKAAASAEGLAKADTESKGLQGTLSTLGGATLLGAAAGFAVFGAAGVKAGMDQQTAVSGLAASAGISVKAANSIGNAFLNTMGTTIYTGTQITTAYSGVAAQLAATEGHALNAKQAMSVMSASMNLAEGTGESLSSTTSDLGKVMQTFQINSSGAAKTSDELFQAARLSGSGLDGVTNTLMKLHSTLGVTSPPLGQLGGILVDLADHGETGRKAMSAMNSAVTTLLKPTTDLANAQQQQSQAMAMLPKSMQSLASQYQAGTMTAAQLSAATKGMTGAQKDQWTAFTSATDSVKKYSENISNAGVQVTNSKGQFVGMKSVISQLDQGMQGMTQTQKLAALQQVFGAQANKQLLAVVEAGPAAYQKATDAVQKHGAAAQAAEDQSQTLSRQFDVMKATAVDLAAKFGAILIPLLTDLMHVLAESVTFLDHHKAALIAVAVVIGGILATAIAVFVYEKATSFIQSVQKMGSEIGGFITKLLGTQAPLEEIGTTQEETAAVIEDSNASIEAAWASVGEAADSMAAEFQVAADTMTEGFAEVDVAADTFAATAAETGEASTVAFGPIGIAIMAVVVIATLLITHWKEVSAVLLDIWNGIKDVAMTVWNFIRDHIKQIAEAILLIVTGPIGALALFLVLHWHQILSDVEAVWGDILAFFKKIPGEIEGFFSDAATWLLQAGKDILNGLWTGFQYLTPEGLIIKFHSQILGALSDALHWLEDAGKDVLTGLLNGVTSVVTSVLSFFTQLPGRILSAIAGLVGSMLSFGGQIIGSMYNGLTGAIGDVISFFTGLWGKISDAIGAFYDDAYHIAGRLIEGLVNGIEDGISKVTDAVGHLVDKAKSEITSGFGLWSPSRVFRGYGVNLMEGLALGVNDNAASPVKSMATAASAIIDKATQTLKTGTGQMATAVGLGTVNGASTSPNTMGAHQEIHLHIQQGAVVINAPPGTTPTQLQPLQDSVQEGFADLARELQAGVAPMRGSTS